MSWIKDIFRGNPGKDDQIAANELSGSGFADWVHGDSTVITADSALAVSSVWSCVRLISNTISTLPISVFERTATGRQKAIGHPISKLLRTPNGYMTHSDFFRLLLCNVLLKGNAYAYILRDATYRPVTLRIYDSSEVTPVKSGDEVFYFVSGLNGPIPSRDIIHLKGLSTDGVKGKSPIAVHRENLQLSIDAQSYGALFFQKGGNTEGLFEHPGQLPDDAYKRLKTQLTERMTGMRNVHKPLLLEGGLKYSRLNIPLDDAQFIATRTFQKGEIASIYGVPPHMIGNLERATFSNIEHQAIEFVTHSISPYLKSIEEEFNRKLFYENELDRFYISFNLRGLMRGDQKSRSDYYRTMFYIGSLTPNEIREMEDMNGYDGGEEFFVQTNMEIIKNMSDNGKDGEGKKIPNVTD